MKFLKYLLVFASAAILSAGAYAEVLNFGIISTESSSGLKEAWQPLIADLNRQTGLDVKPFFATDYSGIIEGMRFNKVQIGYFGNKSAIEVVDRGHGEVFAQIKYANGSLGYYSLLITNTDSPYKTLDDVLKNGKKINFGLGDPESTSGTLVPGYYIFAKNHIQPATFFKTVRSSNHEANMLAVINNQVDVATNNTEMYDKVAAQFPAKIAKVRVLWKSPLIPSDPLVWRTDLPDATKAKLRDFFTHYGKDEHEKAVLKAIYGMGGFRASSNAQLVPVRQLDLFQQRQGLAADAHLDAQIKKSKIAAIDSQLAALDQQVAQPSQASPAAK